MAPEEAVVELVSMILTLEQEETVSMEPLE
jgi:hypothetical protein